LIVNWVMVVVGLGAGLVLVGRGLWTRLRGGPLTFKATGRGWTTAGPATAFWMLLGVAMLLAGLLPVGARTGLIEPDAGFLMGLVPAALCVLAVIGFGPRRLAGPS
jgi:hypothetical protein